MNRCHQCNGRFGLVRYRLAQKQFCSKPCVRKFKAAKEREVSRLSLTLADLGGVGESIFDAAPDMARNFYTISVRPRHAGNLMTPYFAANCRDGVAEGEH